MRFVDMVKVVGLVVVALLAVGTAQAGTISLNGILLSTSSLPNEGELVDYDNTGENPGATIDWLIFEVTAGTTVTFDILADEGWWDLNGDGELTGLNSTLWLYDCCSTPLQVATDNVDANGNLLPDGNGSVSGYDSYFTHTFTEAGIYQLAIGSEWYDAGVGPTGENPDSMLGTSPGWYVNPNGYLWSDHADWLLDMTYDGAVTNVSLNDDPLTCPVPEPATMGLIGLGLAGLALRRRK